MAENVAKLNTEGSDPVSGKAIDGTTSGPMAQADAKRKAEENPEETPLINPSDAEFMEKLRKASDELDDIAAQRSELNANSQAVFARFDRDGLNRHAIRAARAYMKLDPEKRENYDLSYQVMRKALGAPIQDDLFEAYARKQVTSHQASKKH